MENLRNIAKQQIGKLEQQLKAKEQECEFSNLRIIQLQETLSQYETDLSTKDCIVETCKAQYKELEAENEELKYKIFRYEEAFKHSLKCCDTGVEATELANMLRCFSENVVREENYKLHKTLTEIKEIVEHCIKQDICTTCDNSEKCHIEDEEIPTYDVCNLILQKISEVENGFHS